MIDYKNLEVSELKELEAKISKKYDDYKSLNLNLDIQRGKPCKEQLDISSGLFECLTAEDYKAVDGTDCRNYGGIDGIPEAKELFSKMLEVSTKEIIVGGNSSLNMMYDTIARAMSLGVDENKEPWGKLPVVKFLCPSPGYDRHFSICELFNIEMIVIDMKADGPDMDTIEKLVANDEAIKGIWCVPKYSNPDGITYSDEVVDRFAKMKTKAKDFRIFWDNAYTVHHLTDKNDELKDILQACKDAGNPDRVIIFGSTSKVTLPGAGVAAMGSSEKNINLFKKQMIIQTIGPDKLNQLRHVRFLKNIENVENHMKKHEEILKPKFDATLDILDRELGEKNIAWWNRPNGGYFISLFTLDGCAKKVVALADQAGVKITPAGATYPYGKDPGDRNIRIAPTFPSLEELIKAMEVLCICVQLVSIQKILAEK